ncbi:hypothetical protein [Azohydromonas sediminis]|uniref:hypothetical protein n=1 Tax=Azohydromonas sediminis TaxID=2259674 RepID=UPI000E65C94A|nr:hypothetical protein [Azohydromonas sediminis]
MAHPDLSPTAGSAIEPWQQTQQAGPATQILTDRERASADAGIGRRVGENLWEMFVVFDPAQALQQQFDVRAEPFIALHDVGTTVSRRWLAEIASAHLLPVQKLVIRSQGYGVALATIEFVELPVDGAAPLRLYSTDADADSRQRQQLARVLLGASRLGAVLVGDLPAHALAAALRPLHDAVVAGPWRNRELLLLPLSGSGVLAQQADRLGAGTMVHTRVAPTVSRGEEALGQVVAVWNQLHQPLGSHGGVGPTITLSVTRTHAAPSAGTPPAPPAARAGVLPMQPMPDPKASARAAGSETASPLQRYVQRCLEVKGMVSCCVFEPDTQRTLAFAGARPGPAALASHGSALCAALGTASRGLGLGAAAPEAAITLAGHFLVLRPVPQHPGLVLHAVIDRSSTPLVLALRHLERLDEVLAAS